LPQLFNNDDDEEDDGLFTYAREHAVRFCAVLCFITDSFFMPLNSMRMSAHHPYIQDVCFVFFFFQGLSNFS